MKEFGSSYVIAYILYKADLDNHPINSTQAQQLLYCCYGLVMAAFDERLTDEHPKAWPSGPVFLRTLSDIRHRRVKVSMAKQFIANCPVSWMQLINQTIERFWNYSGTALSNWSRRKSAPWDKADPLASLDDREIRLYFTPFIPLIAQTEEKSSSETETL